MHPPVYEACIPSTQTIYSYLETLMSLPMGFWIATSLWHTYHTSPILLYNFKFFPSIKIEVYTLGG